MDNDNLLSNLSQHLLEMLDDDEYYDITIEVGNVPFVKYFVLIYFALSFSLFNKEFCQQIKRKIMKLWYISNYKYIT